jgi:RNA-directed DNA polymerase
LTRKIVKKSTLVVYAILSKEEKRLHKLALRELIRKNRGIKPSKLIKKLNKLIQIWSKSKTGSLSTSVFLELERFLYLHLWKWTKKRHPNLSTKTIKSKYWQRLKNGRLVFGLKDPVFKSPKLRVILHFEVKEQEKKVYKPQSTFLTLITSSTLPLIYYRNLKQI